MSNVGAVCIVVATDWEGEIYIWTQAIYTNLRKNIHFRCFFKVLNEPRNER